MDIIVGEKIKLRAFGGEIIERILVRDCGDVVEITREDEYIKAQNENRLPVVVGFKKADMVRCR